MSRDGACRRRRRRPAPRSARASPRSTAWPSSPARERFGADGVPPMRLWLRVVRSPHARARFTLGDLGACRAHPGLAAVLTAADVPDNSFGIYPDSRTSRCWPTAQVRYRGEAVLALVGDARDGRWRSATSELPIDWTPEPPVARHRRGDARRARRCVQADKPGQCADARPRAARAMSTAAFARCAAVAEGEFETSFVEHAYIEPEAGCARRVGDRIEIHVCTQTPYMDRDEIAHDHAACSREQVRIVPSAIGGGFGGKLDLSVQPLIALAAWKLNRPVRCVYTRPESHGGDHQAPSRAHRARASAATPTGTPASPSISSAISTPAPMPPGARRSPTACRCMRPAPTSCRNVRALSRARSTPTVRPPAPSAASACRRRRSRTRR